LEVEEAACQWETFVVIRIAARRLREDVAAMVALQQARAADSTCLLKRKRRHIG
jgi:hypothetical protein